MLNAARTVSSPLAIMIICIAVKSDLKLPSTLAVLLLKVNTKIRRLPMKNPTLTDNELFNRFWKAYPRKEGKPKALRTFEKLGIDEVTLPLLLKELQRQSKMKDWKHINTKYIPLAQTWLNRRDWEEEQNGTAEDTDTKSRYGNYL